MTRQAVKESEDCASVCVRLHTTYREGQLSPASRSAMQHEPLVDEVLNAITHQGFCLPFHGDLVKVGDPNAILEFGRDLGIETVEQKAVGES